MNDNKPLFSQGLYFKEILNSSAVGTIVLNVTASDKDSGDFGTIGYTIMKGNGSDHFRIDENGTITTNKLLNKTNVELYALVVSKLLTIYLVIN